MYLLNDHYLQLGERETERDRENANVNTKYTICIFYKSSFLVTTF